MLVAFASLAAGLSVPEAVELYEENEAFLDHLVSEIVADETGVVVIFPMMPPKARPEANAVFSTELSRRLNYGAALGTFDDDDALEYLSIGLKPDPDSRQNLTRFTFHAGGMPNQDAFPDIVSCTGRRRSDLPRGRSGHRLCRLSARWFLTYSER